MQLHNLKPAAGAVKNGRRIGRGEGSGSGSTSGKGNKGQQARTGYQSKKGHEGGQMPSSAGCQNVVSKTGTG